MNYALIISKRLELNVRQVEKTVELLESGATVPFIARYRKEATGSLNEVQIAAIRDLLLRLKELDKRREAIIQSADELCVGVKFQSNAEIAGSPRNSFRASLT